MALVKTPSFWILVLLVLGALFAIVAGSAAMKWAAGLFVVCLAIASLLTVLSVPWGRLVGAATLAVAVILGVVLWQVGLPV